MTIRTKFKNNFTQLPQSNQALVYLSGMYSFGAIIANIFVSIFIYKLNNSLEELIIFTIIYFTALVIGFSGIGSLMAYLRNNIKHMFYLSYISFILSFIALLFRGDTSLGIYGYGVLYGLGMGSYWCGIHTQELAKITDTKRDFYSSSLAIINNILKIINPLLVSSIFFIGMHLHIDGYIIIFCIIPASYLISLSYIHKIGDYTPQSIKKDDIRTFLNLKRHKFGHVVFLMEGLRDSIYQIIIPVISLYMLKSEIDIGIFHGILGILSTICIAYLSIKRNIGNRFKYLAIFGILCFGNFIFFAFNFSLIGYVIFSLIVIILSPLYNVSRHVYALTIMDSIKSQNNDFYPAMIGREIILAISRIMSSTLLLAIIYYFGESEKTILQGSLMRIGTIYILHIIAIYLREKYEKHKN